MKISNNLFQKKTIRPWQVVAGHWVGGLNRAREPVGRCWHSIETDSVEAERRPLFGGSVPATAVCCKTLLSGWRYPNRRVQQPAYRQGGGASGSMNPLLHRRAFRTVKRKSRIPPVPTCGSEPRFCFRPPPLRRGEYDRSLPPFPVFVHPSIPEYCSVFRQYPISDRGRRIRFHEFVASPPGFPHC